MMCYFLTNRRVFYFMVLSCARVKAIRVVAGDVTVTAGADAPLFCQAVDTTEKLTSIVWQRQTKIKPRDTDFFVVTSDGKERQVNGLGDRVTFTGSTSTLYGSISLSNVSVLDEGTYTCIFSVFPSGPHSKKIQLTVQVPPVVSVSTDTPLIAGETEEILATCTAANAKPAAEVLWSRGDLKVKEQNNQTIDSEGRVTVTSSLIGVASKELNQKKVQCLVSHPGLKEKTEVDYTLNIHYPPQPVYITSGTSQGETCEFQCVVDANPKPNINWSRSYPAREHLSSVVDNRLIIQTNPDFNGLYICVVSNEYGVAVGSLYVHVIPASGITLCWTLFIVVLIAVVCGFLIWKFELHQHILKRLRPSRYHSGEPAGTDPTQEEVAISSSRDPTLTR